MTEHMTPPNTVSDLVAEILKRNRIDRPVDRYVDLISQGITSVDMVHLMLAIEAAFDITIPQSGLTPENFRSVVTIEALIARLTMPVAVAS